MHHFNFLPIEIKIAILKYNPSFRRISKEIYFNSKDALYEQYGHLNITNKELKNYIYQFPSQFILYCTDNTNEYPLTSIYYKNLKNYDNERIYIIEHGNAYNQYHIDIWNLLN